jgi:transposase
MAYKHGNRYQLGLFPERIDTYVTEDDPVRAYDAIIDELFKDLDIPLDENKVGNSAYDPVTMLKLLVYGYSYGWRSSRKLERAIHHNVSFIWLMGGLAPDHKTIAEFRRNNKKALKKLLKSCARLCMRLNLIEGNTLFVDGTKVRANAGRDNNHTRAHYEEILIAVDKRIDAILAECEDIDEQERDQASLVHMEHQLRNNEHLRNRIKDILSEFDKQSPKTKKGKERTINETDPDSRMMKGTQGSHASYNVQHVVDDTHGLIVHADAVNEGCDLAQFDHQISQAQDVLEKNCTVASADAGYSNLEELAKVDKRGTTVIVPSQRQALHEEEGPFSSSAFIYDEATDSYQCPAGEVLTYWKRTKKKKRRYYHIDNPDVCRNCQYYGICTTSKRGRQVVRYELKERLERCYEEPESQMIYARRKQRVEHPFGHLKHNLGMRNFLLRGISGVRAEASIGATCFNIARLITILGGAREVISTLRS